MSSDGPRSDEVLERKSVEGLLRTTGRLDGVVYIFCCWVSPSLIVASDLGVLLVVDWMELLEAFHVGVIDILSVGRKRSRQRRSVGVIHFEWRTGWWCKGQWLTLLLAVHVRHALIWSSLPLPQDSSNCWLDKPWIFSTHFILMFFSVWIIFISYLCHPLLFLSLLCHLTHPYLLSPHLIFHNNESSYSFYFYLPLCLLLGYGLCAGPTLNMYVYNVWCLLLAFPRLDINLDSSTACPLYSNLRVVLVDNSITHSWSLVPVVCSRHYGENRHNRVSPFHPISLYWVYVALRRKPVWYRRVLEVSLGVWGSTIPMTTWGVLVCTWCHWYGTG